MENNMNIDPEMLEMFRSECDDNFEQAEDSLLSLEDSPGDTEYLNTLFRALHTIKGVSNMMGFENMGRLAHACEELIGIYRDEGVEVSSEGTDLVLGAVDTLKDMAETAASQQVSPEIPDGALLDQLKGLCDRLRGGREADEKRAADDVETQGVPEPGHSHEKPSGAQGTEQAGNENLEAFVFFVEEELPALKSAASAAEEDGNWSEALKKVETLEFAAGDLGFQEVKGLFSALREHLGQEHVDSEAVSRMLLEIERACLEVKGEPASGIISDEVKETQERAGVDPEKQATGEALAQEVSQESADTDFNREELGQGEKAEEDFFVESSQAGEIDQEDLSAFLVFLEEEYPRLREALSAAENQGDWDKVARCADMMEYAARQLELANLAGTLKRLKGLCAMEGEERASGAMELGKQLVEELLALKQIAERRGIFAGPSEKALSSLFISRIITDAEAMNGRLRECSDAVEDCLKLIRQGEDAEIEGLFFSEAVEALRLLYHFCTFYEMDRAGETVLILEDIYNRMGQEEVAANSTVVQITREVTQLLQDAFEAIRKESTFDDSIFIDVLNHARMYISGLPENQVAGVSKQFLNLLDVSPGFHEVATPESNAKIAEAFKKGLLFFEVRVDLDSNPDVAGPFMELGDRLTFITNETIYEGERTEYNFLVATKLSEEEINREMEEIFGKGGPFLVKRCRPREETGQDTALAGIPELETRHQAPMSLSGDERDEELIRKIGQSVEDVSAVSSTVHHAVSVLEQIDCEELLSGLVDSSSNPQARQQVKEMLRQLRNLVQADRHLATSLEELQRRTSRFVTEPAIRLLEWIGLTVRKISGARGMEMGVEIEDGSARISRIMVKALKRPIRELINSFMDQVEEEPGKRPGISLCARSAGDSVFIEIRATFSLHEESARRCIQRAQEHAEDASVSIGLLDNGYFLRITNCNAIVNGIVMQKSGINYVVPVQAIKRILEPSEDEITCTSCDDGYKILRIEDELVSIRPIVGHCQNGNDGNDLLVVVEAQSGLVAYEVDEIVGQEQLRVVPLSGHLSTISGATGCTILGNGDVGIVLDVG